MNLTSLVDSEPTDQTFNMNNFSNENIEASRVENSENNIAVLSYGYGDSKCR